MIDPDLDPGSARGRADLQPASASATGSRRSTGDQKDHLDRLLGDQQLLEHLRASGYAQHQWEPVAAEFARYGLDVLRAWIRSGKIFAQVHAKTGISIMRAGWDLDDDAVQSLGTDTVVIALQSFLEKVLKPGRWDPAKGATLKTFFIGRCLWEFPNVYRDWSRRQEGAYRASRAAATAGGEAHIAAAEPVEQRVLRNEDLRAALAVLSSDTARRVFLLQDMGYTHDEIAKEVGLADAKAVENVLVYQRRRLRNQVRRTAG